MAASTEPTASTLNTTAVTPSPSDLRTKLTHLLASATQQYALKNYSAAAEHFSEAAETQDLINGEMSPENADVLYQYGRCLYHVGVSKSDVLGGKVAGQEEPKRKKRKVAKAEDAGEGSSSALGVVQEEGEDGGKIEEKVDEKTPAAPSNDRPFFQITGDENFTDSEDDDDEAEDGDEEAEEEDDFTIAYEILDMARVLLERKAASLDPATHSSEIRSLRERLADTHDLQAEIKLENEAFADAVADARAAMALKEELYPEDSGIRAEACYKLAIALDFAALPVAPTEEEEAAGKKEESQVDESLRKEAAGYMDLAIKSTQLRLDAEKARLPSLPASEQAAAKRGIADLSSVASEMKNRLVDLQNPVPAASLPGGEGFDGGEEMLRGLLGEMMGAGRGQQKKMVEEATKGANDLSGMVRKKKVKAEVVEDGAAGEGKGKRKAEDGDGEGEAGGKRMRSEDPVA